MPVLYDGCNECQKCSKRFEWVHFEWKRSKLSSGNFYVERVPEKPMAEKVQMVDEQHIEYMVECPYCYYINRFICDKKS